MSRETELLFFTIEVNRNSRTLAHTVSWIEEFAKNFDRVKVICVRANHNFLELPVNVSVYPIGGGSLTERFLAIVKLYVLFFRLRSSAKRQVVLHHMSPYPLLFLGIFYRFLKVPQFLWYSHSRAPKFLYWSVRFVKNVFSPTSDSFPLKSNRVIPVCHGIATSSMNEQKVERQANTILVLGRIAPIKYIEELLFALDSIERQDLKICAIGESMNSHYLEILKNIASEFGIQFEVREPIIHRLIPYEAKKYSIVFSGTRGSVDKAPLESALSGCFVVSNSEALLRCSGMEQLARETLEVSYSRLSVAEQIEIVLKLQGSSQSRSRLQYLCQEQNNLEKLINRLSGLMLSSKCAS